MPSIIHRMFSKMVTQFPLIQKNPDFNPRMVQRPLIDAGNTGRYANDAFMVPFNSPTTGTLAPNSPRACGIVSIDVTAQKAAVYGGMGSIPVTPGSQGLVLGFRSNSL